MTESAMDMPRHEGTRYLIQVTFRLGCSVLKNRNVCLNSVIFMGNYSTGSDMIIKEKDGEKKMRFFNFYDFLVDFSHF